MNELIVDLPEMLTDLWSYFVEQSGYRRPEEAAVRCVEAEAQRLSASVFHHFCRSSL